MSEFLSVHEPHKVQPIVPEEEGGVGMGLQHGIIALIRTHPQSPKDIEVGDWNLKQLGSFSH